MWYFLMGETWRTSWVKGLSRLITKIMFPFCGLAARSSNLNLTGEPTLRICNWWIPIFGANFKTNEQFSAGKSGGISSSG